MTNVITFSQKTLFLKLNMTTFALFFCFLYGNVIIGEEIGMKKNIFYRANDGFTADIIPFYDKGKFKLFYLHDYRNRNISGEGTPWRLIETENLVDYEEKGEVIPRGKITEQDLYIFTGSVYKEADDKYHIFYTGHNPHFKNQGQVQGVMHAISKDGLNWQKVAGYCFYAPKGFEKDDWRDPFVYYDEKTKEYKMLLAARKKEGPKERRGCTVVCKSTDLYEWEFETIFWEPNAYFTHECPDLFKIEDTYYLLYSEFTDKCLTRYVMSKSLNGPWVAPIDDCFDGRAYYAAKTTLSNDKRRYIFGWVPTKEEKLDVNHFMWGGNLLCHEIVQREDKTLGVKIPESVSKYFEQKRTSLPGAKLESLTGVLVHNLVGKSSSAYKLSLDVKVKEPTYSFGILFNQNSALDKAYAYIFEPNKNRLFIDNFPCPEWRFSNFRNVERYLEKRDRYHLELIYQDGIVVLYVDTLIALSCHVYDLPVGEISFFLKHGSVELENIIYYEVEE